MLLCVPHGTFRGKTPKRISKWIVASKTSFSLCTSPPGLSDTCPHVQVVCGTGIGTVQIPQSVSESTAYGFCSGKGSVARQVVDFHKHISPVSRRQCGTEEAELTQELGERLASSVHSASDCVTLGKSLHYPEARDDCPSCFLTTIS